MSGTQREGAAPWPSLRGRKKPLRILLVRSSPVGSACRGPGATPVAAPLGVLYLTAALRRSLGGRVEVAATSLTTAVDHLDEVAPFVEERRPDLLGISVSLADEAEARRLVQAAHRLEQTPVTVVGGPLPSCSPERGLRRTGADLAVVGEAERTVVDLVDALLDGSDPRALPGVAALAADGSLIAGPAAPLIDDLDELGLPAWDAIRIADYTRLRNHNDWPPSRHPYAPILTSRGCPFRCSYCHNVHGRRFRPRSPEDVVREMELLHHRYGVRELHVVDDVFNFDGPRMEAICQQIVERSLPLALAFPNALRGDLLTRRQLELLRDAGCYSINVALESASPGVLARMNRRMDLDRLARNVELASALGIMVGCFVMFGYPGETHEDLDRTFRWLHDSAVDFPRHAIVAPFPGTVTADHALAEGLDPTVMDVDRGSYDWENAGLARMSPRELKQRVREGLRWVFDEPRRRRRMRALWDRWPRSDAPLMGRPPPTADDG